MTHPCRSRAVAVILFAGCALAGPVATASASDNSIRAVINHYGATINADEHVIAKTERAFKHSRHAAPVVTALRHEVSDLHTFVGALTSQSPSSANGSKGRADVVKGLELVSKTYAKLARELEKAGSAGLTQGQYTAAEKVAQKGHDDVTAGLKLLS